MTNREREGGGVTNRVVHQVFLDHILKLAHIGSVKLLLLLLIRPFTWSNRVSTDPGKSVDLGEGKRRGKHGIIKSEPGKHHFGSGQLELGQILGQISIRSQTCSELGQIFVSNKPDVMDPAFFRSGRFGRLLFVPLPDADERGMILKALARNKPIAADVDLIALGRREECANLSGADLRGVMNEASMAAADEAFEKLDATGVFETIPINAKHFEQGLASRRRSVSDERIEYYHRLSERLEQVKDRSLKHICMLFDYDTGTGIDDT
ncbi:hypothetical protein OSB04_014158 [Centaurea solstitialis]|uniref:Uncharacterized protein n=1 Tax=Centaurea solstitialis TaxID=347529 RepID=A0AA38T4C2_9ASTR|nr:hypothetical protein OSB04_014158 [Centaurea solstitialis]